MAIGGEKRTQQDFDNTKKVGMFSCRVLAINPTIEQYKELLGMELQEDSKAADYLGEKEGDTTLRIDVWLQDVKSDWKTKVSFFLQDKERTNKDETKNQWINTSGATSWAENIKDLPDWFIKRDVRKAFVGEEELYGFVQKWLGGLDYRSAETEILCDWKKFMKGNVKELKEQIGGEFETTFGAMATVIVKEKENDEGVLEIKEYQGIYNKGFLPEYSMKNFRVIDYNDEDIQTNIKAKTPKDRKPHEKFVAQVSDESHGEKNIYSFSELHDYTGESIVSSNKVISESSSDY